MHKIAGKKLGKIFRKNIIVMYCRIKVLMNDTIESESGVCRMSWERRGQFGLSNPGVNMCEFLD